MEQLRLPFEESNAAMAERMFKEMLVITPDNPRSYSIKHMVDWLSENPKKELYIDKHSTYAIHYRERG